MSDLFDFGFTAVDEDELEAVQKVNAVAGDAEEKLHKLYNAVIPLLNNLKKNPETVSYTHLTLPTTPYV